MDSTVGGLDGAPLSDHIQRLGLGSHAKLERQGSKGNRGGPTPSRKVHIPPVTRADPEKQSEDLHGLLSMVGLKKYVNNSVYLERLSVRLGLAYLYSIFLFKVL